MKKAIVSTNAPKPAPFFSQAILTESRFKLELGGQIGLDPATGKLVEGGIVEQTEQTFKNIQAILAEVGWDLSHVTKVRVFMTSMDDYGKMNEVYATKFSETPPARAALAVKELPLGALVEIECVAEGEEVSNVFPNE